MKNLMTVLSLLMITLAFGQNKNLNGTTKVDENEAKIESLKIEVTVDSAEEIESTFKIEDIKDILDNTEDNEKVSFKIICNGERMSNGKKSNVSYKVEGNTNNTTEFLKSVEKIRASAINYYTKN